MSPFTWKNDINDREDGLAEVNLVLHVRPGERVAEGEHQLGLGPHHQVMVGVQHAFFIGEKLLKETCCSRIILHSDKSF